jgi:hypothetical protein
LPIGSPKELRAQAERDRKIAASWQAIARIREEFQAEFLKSGKSKLPAEALAAFRREPAKRSAAERGLVFRYYRQFVQELTAALPGPSKQQIAAQQQKIRELRQKQPDLPRGYFLQELSPKAPDMHLLYRGNASRPGPKVAPGLPTVLVAKQPPFLAPDGHTTRRRLTLARWIASKDNPMTARVIVNRVWQYHFGEGLVTSPSDFGTMGDPPTHPELLDWLADWFLKEKWSLKKLHRLIVTSNAYRMAKTWLPECGRKDPENSRLWRVHYRRLEVEAIRDAMLAVSGRLNRKMYGPSMYPHVPKEALSGHSDPDKIWKPFQEQEASRRTVYAFVKRSMVVPLLEVLDLCDTARSTAKRVVTTIAPQALTLMNGHFVNRQARHFADRLEREVGDAAEKQIDRAYRLALCRPPTRKELAVLTRFLRKEADGVVMESARRGKEVGQKEARRMALQQMCRVILNLNEFVYTD